MRRLFVAFTTLATVALLVYLAVQGWLLFGPKLPELGPQRQKIADQVITQVTDDLYRLRPPNIRTVFLFQLENDPSDYVSDGLRQAIQESGVFELRDRAPGDRFRKALRLRIPAPRDFQSAVEQCRRLGVDALLYGTVQRLESNQGSSRMDLELTLAELANGQPVFRRTYSKEIVPESAVALTSPSGSAALALPGSPAQRFIGWLLFVLLLPVVTLGFARATVRKESNSANALALGVYTIVDAALWLLVVGVAFSAWVPVVCFLLGTAAAFAYNTFILSFALKLET